MEMQPGVSPEFLEHLEDAHELMENEPCPLTGCKAGESCHGHTKHMKGMNDAH